MEHLGESLEAIVRGLGSVAGGLGLFAVAFFDSSLLSLPEINDLLLVYFSAEFHEKAYYYALMSVAGSASGASLLYALARWKGYKLLRRKFPKGRIDSVFGLVRRYGALAVVVPAVLPPPFPLKIFVLSSGALGLPYSRFLAAILAGRAIRYFGEAYLAVRYGELATSYLRQNTRIVFYAALAAAVVVAGVALWRRAREKKRRRVEAPPLAVGAVEEP